MVNKYHTRQIKENEKLDHANRERGIAINLDTPGTSPLYRMKMADDFLKKTGVSEGMRGHKNKKGK